MNRTRSRWIHSPGWTHILLIGALSLLACSDRTKARSLPQDLNATLVDQEVKTAAIASPVAAAWHGDEVWVLDQRPPRLLVYSPEFTLIDSVQAQGQGPGEFNHPVAFTVLTDGSFCLVDFVPRRVVCFGHDRMFRNQWALPSVLPSSTRIAGVSAEEVLLSLADPDSLFSRYRTDGTLIRKFGDLPVRPLQYNAVTFALLGDRTVLSSFKHFNELRHYDLDGRLITSERIQVQPVLAHAQEFTDLRERTPARRRLEPIPMLLSASASRRGGVVFTGPRFVAVEPEAVLYLLDFDRRGSLTGTTRVHLPDGLVQHVFDDIAVRPDGTEILGVLQREAAILRIPTTSDGG